MSDIVWAINPDRDHLGDLIQRMRRFASDILSATGIEFEFNAPSVEDDVSFGANLRREAFLTFKESLNNIVKHSGAAHVLIDLEYSGGFIVLAIVDNGSGFDTADITPQLYSEQSGGNGIFNMRKRAAEMGGDISIASVPGRGTTVRLTLPLEGPRDAEKLEAIQKGGDETARNGQN